MRGREFLNVATIGPTLARRGTCVVKLTNGDNGRVAGARDGQTLLTGKLWAFVKSGIALFSGSPKR